MRQNDEDNFKLFADNLPTLAWMTTADGHIFWYNKKWYEYTGTTLEDVEGWKWQRLHHEDYVDKVTERWTQALEDKEPWQMTFPLRAADGVFRMFDTRVAPIRNEDGVVVRWVGVNSEITKLIDAESRYRAIVNSAVDSMVVIDDVGTIQSINLAAEKAIGYAPEEIIGQNIKLIVPDEVAIKHDDFLKRYRETGVKHILDQITDVEVKRKDGTLFPAEIGITEWTTNEGRFFTGTMKDVTERKNYQDQLLDLNKQLQQKVEARTTEIDMIFEMSADILGVINFDGNFESVSPAFETITGYSTAEWGRRPFIEIVHPDDRAETLRVYGEALKGHQIVNYEVRGMHKNGSPIWTSWTISPVAAKRQMFAVGRDVTAQKAIEETLRQSQKMEAIGQLTGGISHDFNNLLMGISGSLEMVNRLLTPEQLGPAKKYIDGMTNTTARASTLTQRLLAFARRQPLDPRRINPNIPIEALIEMGHPSLGPSIDIQTQLGQEVWEVLCDPNQLENAVLNVMLNARDAMEDASGQIYIKTYNETRPEGDHVCISVGDNGQGMTEDVKAKAFDPFFTTKPIGAGTGLGLSMLYGFVKQSSGHVNIVSEVNVGTTILIYLPRYKSDDAQVTHQEVIATPSGENRNKTILLIEDEPVIRELITEELTQAGFSCIAVGEGNAALVVAEDHSQEIDLLITDVGLPGLNGKQIAEMIRIKRDSLPVIFITGYAAGVTVRSDLLLRDTHMLLKPFTISTLLEKAIEVIR